MRSRCVRVLGEVRAGGEDSTTPLDKDTNVPALQMAQELPYAPPFPASAKYYFHDEDSASNLVLGGVGSSGVSEGKVRSYCCKD